MTQNQNRRSFIKHSITTSTAIATSFAINQNRVLGANERIRIGMIGCGWRSQHHVGWIQRSSQEVPAEVIAVCDVWEKKLNDGAAKVKERFEKEPVRYTGHRKLLENKDIDAVVIATPDHQHSPQLIDAVQAGKDAYVEKPIASDLDILNQAYDAVTATGRIVQNGTQGRSSKGARAAMEFIQSGKLGKVLRIEESRSHYIPYWNHYETPQSKDATHWDKFLMHLPPRPFDADRHGHWMGYKEYSPNTIGGWMSHLSDFVHYLTNCGYPVSSIAHGGIYSPTSEEQRTCPDTVTAIVDYPEGFTTLFTTHFGNGANDYTLIFGTKGTMRIHEPDGNHSDGIYPRVSGEGSEHPGRLPMEEKVLEEIPQDNHMINWLKCIKSREQPNANMEAGYKQGIAVLLAERARINERKMIFDRSRREMIHA